MIPNFIDNLALELRSEMDRPNPYLRDAAEIHAEVLEDKRMRLRRLEKTLKEMRAHTAIVADECAALGAEIEEMEQQ